MSFGRQVALGLYKAAVVATVLGLYPIAVPSTLARSNLSDADIRKQMIEGSIRGYSGNCPCPYSRASNGSSCGKRSAYSRPGGASPLCYPEDIPDDAVRSYRRSRGL
jgi:hypothetical protein